MIYTRSMEGEAVRQALLGLRDAEDRPYVVPAEIGDVAVDGDWTGIKLGSERPSRAWLGELHDRLRPRLPGMQIELRAGSHVHRGGRGFGVGKHVIAVLGGKGGVGKSTVAVNLALTLAAMDYRVGILDADLNGPDVPHLLGIHPPPARQHADPRHGMFHGGRGQSWQLQDVGVPPPSRRPKPHRRFDVEMHSVGLAVPEGYAPNVSGQLFVSTIVRYLAFEVSWSADVLVVDAPPGTGAEVQAIARELPLSGALFVTTPQDLAQMDAERTLALLRAHDVPVIGVVQNMASLICPHCEREVDMYAGSTRLADAGVPIIGRIPFDLRLAAAADRGQPLVLGDPTGPIAHEFGRIGAVVRRWLRGTE